MKVPGVRVVILTALEVEYQAVRSQLTGVRDVSPAAGTLFEVGDLPQSSCRVAIALSGAGGMSTAVVAERAIERFRPKALFFVGIAGALHSDLILGDVLFGTKVYAYQGGREDDRGLHAAPEVFRPPHWLEQIARQLSRTGEWRTRLPNEAESKVRVHFRPLAAGEVVLNSQTSQLRQWLHEHYVDAAAIEMESAGVGWVGHLNRSVSTATIRGISDHADSAKYVTDARGHQDLAVVGAAAFAAALATRVPARRRPGTKILLAMAFAALLSVCTGALTVPTVRAFLSDLYCHIRSESRLSAAYNIVVGTPAVDMSDSQTLDKSIVDRLARDIRDALEHHIQADEMVNQGLVQVGHPCTSTVSKALGGRADLLAHEREAQNGDVAISFILAPHRYHTKVQLELSLGGSRFGDAAELAGYADLDEVDLGNLDGAGADRNLLTTAAERVAVYVRLLRGIYEYSTEQYWAASSSLQPLTTDPVDRRLNRLVLVLLGNIRGRLSTNGDYSAAKIDYEKALQIDPSYPRAKLGLAEIAYHAGSRDCTTLGGPDIQSLSYAYTLYDQVYDASSPPDVPDVDARAKAGTGRVEMCRFLSGDTSQLAMAIHDFRFVTDRYMQNTDKFWLKTSASESFGFLGALYAEAYHDLEHAIACYEQAENIAFRERSKVFADMVQTLRKQQEEASPAPRPTALAITAGVC